MKVLTVKEEQEILARAFEINHFIDHGSSRLVFDLEDGTVLKVAFDSKGQYQNEVEAGMYKSYGDRFLAVIHAVGEYVVLQEKVEILECFYEVHKEFIYEIDHGDLEALERFGVGGYTYEEVLAGIGTREELDNMLGETEDNLQIGRRKETGAMVCFDYGYEVGSDRYSVSQGVSGLLADCGWDYREVIIMIADKIEKAHC